MADAAQIQATQDEAKENLLTSQEDALQASKDATKVGDHSDERFNAPKRSENPPLSALLAHSAEVSVGTIPVKNEDGSISFNKPEGKLGGTSVDEIQGTLGINDKSHDAVGSTKDADGRAMVQADGGHTGPGNSTYVGTALDVTKQGKKVEPSIIAAGGGASDPLANGWQTAKPA